MFDTNLRRRVILAIGASALAAPFASLSQQPNKVWRVGFLAQRHMEFVDADYYYGPFTQGMRELGYVVGKNLVIEWRSAEGKSERLPELAAELVRLKLDVLATQGTPAAVAARKATTTMPIVISAAIASDDIQVRICCPRTSTRYRSDLDLIDRRARILDDLGPFGHFRSKIIAKFRRGVAYRVKPDA